MEALIYIANTLYIFSYIVRDIFQVRLLTVTAALVLVAYFYCQPEPMMTIVCWNLFFIGLNVAQIIRILGERRGWHRSEKKSFAGYMTFLREICSRFWRVRGSP